MDFPKKVKYLTFGDPGRASSLAEIFLWNILQIVRDREFISTEGHH